MARALSPHLAYLITTTISSDQYKSQSNALLRRSCYVLPLRLKHIPQHHQALILPSRQVLRYLQHPLGEVMQAVPVRTHIKGLCSLPHHFTAQSHAHHTVTWGVQVLRSPIFFFREWKQIET